MTAVTSAPLLEVEHLTMRFGGLVAVDDVSFAARPREITGDHRPQRRRQDHGLQLHHRLLQADRRPAHRCTAASGSYLLERMDGPRDRPEGQGRAHLPEHPPVPRHDGAGEPDGRAAQQADARLGHDRRSACSASRAIAAPRPTAVEKARGWLERIGLVADADRPAGSCPMARSGGSRSRARCAPTRVLLCLDEPAAGLNPRESAELNELLVVDPRRATASACC